MLSICAPSRGGHSITLHEQADALSTALVKSLHVQKFRIAKSRPFDRIEMLFARRQLEQFKELEQDWDGYGAVPIHEETVRNSVKAIEAFSDVAQWADKYPNPNGTVSFEWESPLGTAYLEIGRTKYSFYIKAETGRPIYANGSVDQINPALGELVSDNLFPLQTATYPISKIELTASGVEPTGSGLQYPALHF
jgi:hypothetical protein